VPCARQGSLKRRLLYAFELRSRTIPLNKNMNAQPFCPSWFDKALRDRCDKSHRGLLNLLPADLLSEGPSKSVDGRTDW
jgi:hypothetical protein